MNPNRSHRENFFFSVSIFRRLTHLCVFAVSASVFVSVCLCLSLSVQAGRQASRQAAKQTSSQAAMQVCKVCKSANVQVCRVCKSAKCASQSVQVCICKCVELFGGSPVRPSGPGSHSKPVQPVSQPVVGVSQLVRVIQWLDGSVS